MGEMVYLLDEIKDLLRQGAVCYRPGGFTSVSGQRS